LTSCSGHPASGAYVAKEGDSITLVDLVEGDHGQIVGRLEAASVRPDGAFSDQGGSVSGQRDGKHLSLTVSAGLSSVAATAELHGSALTLSGPAFSSDFSRSTPEAFQKGLAELRARSASIIAERVKAEADAAADRAQAQAEAIAAADRAQSTRADQGLIAQADALASRLSRAESTLSAASSRFTTVVERVDHAVTAARASHLNSLRLGQLSLAIGQTLIQIDGQHDQLKSGEQSLDYTIQQQLNADATARAHCSALANADAGLIQACGELLSHDQKLREAIPAVRSAIQATEAAYTKSHAQIEAAQHEVDNLGQGVG
jgi:chromosome segregation ATPase